jgi:hypothetical protein
MNELHTKLLEAITEPFPEGAEARQHFNLNEASERFGAFSNLLRRLQTNVDADDISRLILVYSAAEKALDDQLRLLRGIPINEDPEITKLREGLERDINELFENSIEGVRRAYFEVPDADGRITRFTYKVIGVIADTPIVAVCALLSDVLALRDSIPTDKPRFIIWRRHVELNQEYRDGERKTIWVATVRVDIPFADWSKSTFATADGMDLKKI